MSTRAVGQVPWVTDDHFESTTGGARKLDEALRNVVVPCDRAIDAFVRGPCNTNTRVPHALW